MTKEQAENLIILSLNGNGINFRENIHMHLVLLLMYRCHLKPAYIYKLRPIDIQELEDGTGIGRYTTKRWGNIHEFNIDEYTMHRIKLYMKEHYWVPKEAPLLQVKERAMRKLFVKMADWNHVNGSLIDVYYAGLEER